MSENQSLNNEIALEIYHPAKPDVSKYSNSNVSNRKSIKWDKNTLFFFKQDATPEFIEERLKLYRERQIYR